MVIDKEQAKILSPTGKAKWCKRTIDVMLSNEKYTGNVRLLKSGESEVQYFAKDNNPTIISKEVFVIDTINQKAGGSTKCINQRDQDFIGVFLQEENYRRGFTDALRDYVSMGNAKNGIYTDKMLALFHLKT